MLLTRILHLVPMLHSGPIEDHAEPFVLQRDLQIQGRRWNGTLDFAMTYREMPLIVFQVLCLSAFAVSAAYVSSPHMT